MKKFLLLMIVIFAGAGLTMGQIDTVMSPFHAKDGNYQWGMGDYQAGCELIVKANYRTANCDSVRFSWMHFTSAWAHVRTDSYQLDGSVGGSAIDGVLNDTITTPADFDLITDDATGIFLMQVAGSYSDASSAWSNGGFRPVAAYKDSVAIDTVINHADKQQLGEINLGDTIKFRGHYGIDGVSNVEVQLMHLNSGWGTVKVGPALVVYSSSPKTGIKMGRFDISYGIPKDFNTVEDLAAGDFFVLRTMVKYSSGTNKFFFSWLSVVNKSVTGISLSKTTLNLEYGNSELLESTVTPSTAEDKTITWSTSDESIAYIEQTGLVTGVGLGTATITATTTDGGFTATCDVTVVPPVAVKFSTLKEVNIYPNPANDVVNISGLNSGVYHIAIYNMIGAKMSEVEVSSKGITRLSLKDLARGIYIIDINGAEGRIIEKISKQ